jgi:hypothetical protein
VEYFLSILAAARMDCGIPALPENKRNTILEIGMAFLRPYDGFMAMLLLCHGKAVLLGSQDLF